MILYTIQSILQRMLQNIYLSINLSLYIYIYIYIYIHILIWVPDCWPYNIYIHLFSTGQPETGYQVSQLTGCQALNMVVTCGCFHINAFSSTMWWRRFFKHSWCVCVLAPALPLRCGGRWREPDPIPFLFIGQQFMKRNAHCWVQA